MVECPAKREGRKLEMYFTYILRNNNTGRHYVGSTNNLERRIKEHNRGQTKSTRAADGWELLFKEGYLTSKDAKKREREIKSYKGGNLFKKLIGLQK